MKNCCRYILLVLFLFTGADLFASVYNGGLYFKSHSAPSVDRTSLTLNDDKPFDVSNEFTISFQMLSLPCSHERQGAGFYKGSFRY